MISYFECESEINKVLMEKKHYFILIWNKFFHNFFNKKKDSVQENQILTISLLISKKMADEKLHRKGWNT